MKKNTDSLVKEVNRGYVLGKAIPSPFIKDMHGKIKSLRKDSNKEYISALEHGFTLAIKERRLQRDKELAQIKALQKEDRSRDR